MNYSLRKLPVIVFFILFIILISGCVQSGPIKIGVVMTLTGRASTSGIRIRSGMELAVQEINDAGGINGREIELVVRDDKGDPEEALKVDKELIEEGVTAVLGHNFSTLAIKTVPLFNEKNVLMIGAVVSTLELSGLDDNFIRLIPSVEGYASRFAKLAYENLRYRKMTVVYDISNISYTEAQYKHFKKGFEAYGGSVPSAVVFDTKDFSAPDVARQISETNTEAVFVIANAIDAALICQHLRRIGSDIKIIDSSWAASVSDFTKNGGHAVNGVVFLDLFNAESDNETLKVFGQKYKEKYEDDISLHAQVGYEAAMVLIEGLKKTTDPGGLKNAILRQGTFQGVDGDITFDEFGDMKRPFYIKTIENGVVKTIGRIGE